ncbi:MAG: NTP/NDP exchange transporter [Myxococcota bacterium]
MEREGFLKSLFDVRPDERRIAALMCGYFFLVITSFWVLKPIKKTLFIQYYVETGFDFLGRHFSASEAELLAKVLNMFVAAAAAAIFGLLASRMRRQQLTYTFSAFFIALYFVFAFLLSSPAAASVWSFYLFGDLFSTIMVATFYSFLNDSVNSDAAKRLYGLIGFGGVAGGAFGSTVVALWIDRYAVSTWLLFAAAIAVVIVLLAWAASRALPDYTTEATEATEAKKTREAGKAPASDEDDSAETAGGGALRGAQLVFRSSYLLSIVAIVGVYELVSTLVDFQFTSAIVAFSEDAASRSQNFATVYATSNWLAMFVQLFLTSLVMRRFGMTTALLVLPTSIAMASAGFLLAPSLLLGGMLSISDNGFSYSLNQSAKEALYVPTSVEEKYQAKAFIDMFVQRFAKALGVGLSLIITAYFTDIEGIRLLTFFVLPLLGVWVFAAITAGRRFSERTTTESTHA